MLCRTEFIAVLCIPPSERGDSYGYDYSEGEEEEEEDEVERQDVYGQLTYEEAYNVGQKALRAGKTASMHARDRRYPRSYDSEGYAADSTDSTEVDMNVYGVRHVTYTQSRIIVFFVTAS